MTLGAHQIAGEPVPVTKTGATADEECWLPTLVLDADAGRTEVWVLDGADVAAPPVAVVPLPHIVPFGFHGNWVRAAPNAPASWPFLAQKTPGIREFLRRERRGSCRRLS